jgi:DNA-binding NarL/FixJ family response regulator
LAIDTHPNDALQLFERLASLHTEKVVFTADCIRIERREQALRFGVDDFLLKNKHPDLALEIPALLQKKEQNARCQSILLKTGPVAPILCKMHSFFAHHDSHSFMIQ